MTLRLTLILSAVFLFGAFALGALFTTQACFMAGAGTGYPSLQQAINRADPGCTIILLGGTYQENVVIDKPLRIIPRAQAKPFAVLGQHPAGSSASAAFIDPASPSALQAANPDRPVVEIRASHVEIQGLRIDGGTVGIQATGVRDVHLRSNTISGPRDAGIRLEDVRQSSVQGNTVLRSPVGLQITNAQSLIVSGNSLRRNGQGIRLENASASRLQDNEIANGESAGLRLTSSHGNEIRQNAILANAAGVVIENSSENTLVGNQIDRNDAPLRVRGSETSHYVHRITRDNSIDGRPIRYLVDAHDVTLSASDNPGYLALVRSRNVTVRGVRLPEGSQGVLLIATRQSTIHDVTIPASEQGLFLQDADDNALIGNRVERTAGSGITLARSSANRLERNVVRANEGHGVFLQNADANALVANDVRDNEQSGIHLTGSRGGRLTNNQIIGNWVGVYLERGGEHRLSANTISKSQFAVYVHATSTNQFEGNRLAENRHASNRPELLDHAAPSDGTTE